MPINWFGRRRDNDPQTNQRRPSPFFGRRRRNTPHIRSAVFHQPLMSDSQPQQSRDSQPEANAGASSGSSLYDRMKNLRNSLMGSQKGGLGSRNSDMYNAVENSIQRVLGCLDKRLGDDAKENQEKYQDTVHAYAELIGACDKYLKRRPWTAKGKIRQDIVKQIRELAETDAKGFQEAGDRISTLSDAERRGSLKDVLQNVRRRTLQLRTGTDKDLEHTGGAVSHLSILKPGDLTDANASGYFKDEEIFTYKPEKDRRLDLLEQVRKDHPLSDNKYNYLKQELEKGEKIDSLKGSSSLSDPQSREFMSHLAEAEQSQKITYHMFGRGMNMNLKEGDTVRVSNRNVATSRIANMLGIGDLIAQSETAEFRDAGGGTPRKGNLMQKARGQQTLMDYGLEQIKPEFLDKIERTGYVDHLTGLSSKVTPDFMKSMSSLQVLDNLTGQADRHFDNIMIYALADGTMKKVQGIDNDFSFGKTDLIGTRNVGMIGNEGRAVLNEKGEMSLPHMDATLADRILELREGEVKLVLSDVLEGWAVNAFWGRVQTLQAAIQKDKEINPNSGRYISRDEDWNENALKDFRKNERELKDQNGNPICYFPTSYISDFMANTEGNEMHASPYHSMIGILQDDYEHKKSAASMERLRNEYRAMWHKDPDTLENGDWTIPRNSKGNSTKETSGQSIEKQSISFNSLMEQMGMGPKKQTSSRRQAGNRSQNLSSKQNTSQGSRGFNMNF